MVCWWGSSAARRVCLACGYLYAIALPITIRHPLVKAGSFLLCGVGVQPYGSEAVASSVHHTNNVNHKRSLAPPPLGKKD